MVPKGDAKPGAVTALRDVVAPRGGETLHPHPVPRPGHLILCLSSLGTESRAGMLLTPIQTPRCWSIPCEHRSSADVLRGRTPLWPRISTPRGLTLLAGAPKPHPHPRDAPKTHPRWGRSRPRWAPLTWRQRRRRPHGDQGELRGPWASRPRSQAASLSLSF